MTKRRKMSKAWIFLFLAAFFETGWTYALKFMSFASLKTAWATQENLGSATIPFIAYIFFGGANIYCLSVALKEIPTATAIAIWTAVSLVLIKICDVLYFKTPTNYQEIFFMLLIVIGIIGMKQYAAS
jgi:quaternary ammonium compound-resistance protein SugE